MDQDQSSGARKVKYTPKPPSRRKPRPTTLPKVEAEDEDDEDAARNRRLLRRFSENLGRKGPQFEKKSSVQVEFGPGASSSTSIRTYGVSRDQNNGKRSGSELKDSSPADTESLHSSLPVVKADENDALSSDSTNAQAQKIKKEYREPWDYHHSYYPTILPFRRPYSGDPEILDESEFREARDLEYDESTINTASELGLLEETEKERMFFFQLPNNLPLVKRSASRKGKEKVGSSLTTAGASKKEFCLEDLSEGCMGKMLIYKSGAVKLKLGDNLYDVSPGSDCIFAQDVAAINIGDKECCVLGELGKRAVVTPDVDSLLNDVIDLS